MLESILINNNSQVLESRQTRVVKVAQVTDPVLTEQDNFKSPVSDFFFERKKEKNKINNNEEFDPGSG